MFNPEKRLIVDVKIQNRLREKFSKIAQANPQNLRISCIEFGDSDVDYRLSYDYTKIRVLNAPYNIERIKSRLVYQGLNRGLTGNIFCYKRYVDSQGYVSSYYQYPDSNALSLGVLPPTLANGFDNNTLFFGNDPVQGWVCFLETVPDGYYDDQGNQLRLPELYTFTVTNLYPDFLEITLDEVNGSFFASKLLNPDDVAPHAPYEIGRVVAVGQFSGLTKTIILTA